MARTIKPNDAVLRARARRAAGAGARAARTQWFHRRFTNTLAMHFKTRVRLATKHLKRAVQQNIGTPVVRGITRNGRTTVLVRSKPGEYPRAETSNLKRQIFDVVRTERDQVLGHVGTPLEYGAILELSQRLRRTYLRRTLAAETDAIRRILCGPIKGAA